MKIQIISLALPALVFSYVKEHRVTLQYSETSIQWRSHTSGVRGVRSPCQENTKFFGM